MFSSVTHLGHIFDCCLSFAKDIVCKKGKFVACVNNIVTELGFAHFRCKAKMVLVLMAAIYGIYLGQICQKLFITMEYCHENYNSQIQPIADF